MLVEVLDHGTVLIPLVEHEQVVAHSSIEYIVAATHNQGIVALTTIELIIAQAAYQRVISLAAM